jgi:hypothetical protein
MNYTLSSQLNISQTKKRINIVDLIVNEEGCQHKLKAMDKKGTTNPLFYKPIMSDTSEIQIASRLKQHIEKPQPKLLIETENQGYMYKKNRNTNTHLPSLSQSINVPVTDKLNKTAKLI